MSKDELSINIFNGLNHTRHSCVEIMFNCQIILINVKHLFLNHVNCQRIASFPPNKIRKRRVCKGGYNTDHDGFHVWMDGWMVGWMDK